MLIQVVSPLAASAQVEYKVLAPLPGTYKAENKTDLTTYIEGMFKLLIALSAIFAVFMIVIGGFQYMTSDALQGKQEGRERIANSIKGLILVIGAWLILYTVDDRLLTINLSLSPANVPAPQGGGGTAQAGTGSVCANCTPVNGSGLNFSRNTINHCERMSQGCFLNQDLVNKLKNIPGITITEVWPPSVNHQAACHRNGTCVDATISNMTNVDTVKNFIGTATQSGVRPVFETSDQNLINQLLQSGVSQNNLLFIRQCNASQGITSGCITGPHFSLYN